jgi:hypothetical protein
MPKTTIPEKWLKPPNNYLTSRFEILPPTTIGASSYNERERKRRTQRDSAEKPSKFGHNVTTMQIPISA